MKKNSQNLLLVLTLLATILWFAGSWWYYSCKIKNTCGNQQVSASGSLTPVVDSDADGISDAEEQKIGTDPHLADSDHDGTPDNEEVGSNINIPLDTDHDGIIDALDEDDDNDGLASSLEIKIGTNPLLSDTDQDGFSDKEEVGSHPKRPLDTDGDGINNALDTDDDDDGILTYEEILLGTNFLLVDSDGDGLSDSIEIGENIEKPLDSDNDGIIDALDTNDNNNDQDHDGLTDQIEALINTDPNNADTDGDGIGDAEEVGANTSSPLDSDLDGIIDALDTIDDSDSDGDGLSNSLEIKLGSNPNNIDSDNDGINDKLEVGNDLNNPLDSDNDGILNINDPDDDNDKLSTRYESQIGTNPIAADSDGDGISDYEEQEILRKKIPTETTKTNHNQKILSIEKIGNPVQGSIQAARIYFPSGSINQQITSDAKKYFAEIINWLKNNPQNMILLTGHTDNVGSEHANLLLGTKRAIAIKNFLIKKGANKKQIEVKSKGETQPIANNNTKEGRWKNRRVEIIPYNKTQKMKVRRVQKRKGSI